MKLRFIDFITKELVFEKDYSGIYSGFRVPNNGEEVLLGNKVYICHKVYTDLDDMSVVIEMALEERYTASFVRQTSE